jgi:hypothetical protein
MNIEDLKTGMKSAHLESLPISLAIIFIPLDVVHGHYYLDPGTGSLLIQLAIGALAGGWFIIKNHWGRIKHFFSELFTAGKKDENDED